MIACRTGLALSLALAALSVSGCKSKKTAAASKDKAVAEAAAAGGVNKPQHKDEVKSAKPQPAQPKAKKPYKDPLYKESLVMSRFGLKEADLAQVTPKVELGKGSAVAQLSKVLEASVASLKGAGDKKQAVAVMVGVMKNYELNKLHIQRLVENQNGKSEPDADAKRHSDLKDQLKETLENLLKKDPTALKPVVVKFQRAWGIRPKRD